MGVIAEGILRGYQGLSTPVSLGYPLSVFNKNSTLKQKNRQPVEPGDLKTLFGNKLRHVSFMSQ